MSHAGPLEACLGDLSSLSGRRVVSAARSFSRVIVSASLRMASAASAGPSRHDRDEPGAASGGG